MTARGALRKPQGRQERGLPGVTTPAPGPKGGPGSCTVCRTQTVAKKNLKNLQIKLIADWRRNDSARIGCVNLRLSVVRPRIEILSRGPLCLSTALESPPVDHVELRPSQFNLPRNCKQG